MDIYMQVTNNLFKHGKLRPNKTAGDACGSRNENSELGVFNCTFSEQRVQANYLKCILHAHTKLCKTGRPLANLIQGTFQLLFSLPPPPDL